ncbi:uncharacterized protein B0I36DRAFT_162923 [Microdochium trichocladiopsis]|uniref:Uncharacterized protein n=1 Tax=Microdochium trichocladiopsis TaxID=1682393 RepID=A0A9P9BIS8_9PEZI|nr:uncharacterized protein B0I36DRAFT_162923 [Microdochium trichocladiopsis]KAH7024563.1 hypothetical protein B0I36DRAFT_162923 [Microdochium trichocladiopsis]
MTPASVPESRFLAPKASLASSTASASRAVLAEYATRASLPSKTSRRRTGAESQIYLLGWFKSRRGEGRGAARSASRIGARTAGGGSTTKAFWLDTEGRGMSYPGSIDDDTSPKLEGRESRALQADDEDFPLSDSALRMQMAEERHRSRNYQQMHSSSTSAELRRARWDHEDQHDASPQVHQQPPSQTIQQQLSDVQS